METTGRPPDDSPDVDWEPLAALCRGIAEGLPELADTITDRIRAANPAYASIPRDEHVRFIYVAAGQVLAGLAERRPPGSEMVTAARDLGSRRALQGTPIEVVLDAYHIGYRELWNALLTRANDRDPDLVPKLVHLVNLMWSWLRASSGASADAHSETLRSQQVIQTGLIHRLLRTLRTGDARSDETAHLARALAYDPDGLFQAYCVPTSEPGEDLGRRLRLPRGVVHCADQGTVTVILCQDLASTEVIERIDREHPRLPVGVGLCRRGLEGAAESIVDAERTLALAMRAGGAVDFQSEWLFATLLTHRHQLAPLLGAGQCADDLPVHLVEAVRAYAEHGFSVSAAARALHVHPNTVSYRLDRWQRLTGWTPRTLDGLMKSLLCLRLYPAADNPPESPGED